MLPSHPPPAEAAPALRRLALWCDDPAALAPWSAALRDEGLDGIELSACTEPADAIVLRITRSLSEQLARLRELRRQHPFTPLLVACRLLRELDQVLALEMGADDVLDADWGAHVLAARLRAQWRRLARTPGAAGAGVDVLRFGALAIGLRERTVLHRERAVALTEGEFEVLWLLASHAGVALSRRDILARVRGLDDQPLDRSIDSRVYRIRAKLGDVAQQRIRTVRHLGYLFSPLGW